VGQANPDARSPREPLVTPSANAEKTRCNVYGAEQRLVAMSYAISTALASSSAIADVAVVAQVALDVLHVGG